MGTERIRRGQALMELSVGIFTVALVVSALCGFAVYIAKSLKMQNSLRVDASSQTDKVEVSDWAAQYVFGVDSLKIKEEVKMPQMLVIQ